MSKKQRFANQLSSLLPFELALFISERIVDNDIHFIVSKNRKSKLGDYRFDPKQDKHIISVNVGLSKVEFFVTSLHEFAHYFAFKNFGRRIRPHGEEWKREYRSLLQQALQHDFQLEGLHSALLHEIKKPSVTHKKPLMDKPLRNDEIVLKDLKNEAVFSLKGRRFKKLELRRTRYFCQCVDSKRFYTIHKDAIVKLEK